MAAELLHVCMTCHPGLRTPSGARLSHGYCERHGLEELLKAALIEPAELRRLYWLRFRAKLAVFAQIFLVLACSWLLLKIFGLLLGVA